MALTQSNTFYQKKNKHKNSLYIMFLRVLTVSIEKYVLIILLLVTCNIKKT